MDSVVFSLVLSLNVPYNIKMTLKMGWAPNELFLKHQLTGRCMFPLSGRAQLFSRVFSTRLSDSLDPRLEVAYESFWNGGLDKDWGSEFLALPLLSFPFVLFFLSFSFIHGVTHHSFFFSVSFYIHGMTHSAQFIQPCSGFHLSIAVASTVASCACPLWDVFVEEPCYLSKLFNVYYGWTRPRIWA